MIDIPGVGNNSTASTPASSTTTVTSSTSSITPTSSCSSTTSSNLRDLENLVKQQQPRSGTGKTVPSSSNVVNNPNTISPTAANSTTNSSSDLRRTQHEIEDPDYVSVPRLCPGVNCPEKIVLCLDLSSEMEQMKFLSRAGDRFSTLQLVKRTIGLFVQSKHRLDNRHEFGLVTVHETAAWFRDFTKDPRDISNLIEDLDETCDCSALDIGSLLKVILRRVELPVMEDPSLPPPYIVRVILIIGRSQSKLELDHEVHKMLVMSPYLFIDVFYVHEPPSEHNCCEQIFDQLCSLDVKGQSYIFEVSKNLTKLYDNMAQLLAHPLQRPLQKDTSNRIRANMEEG
ncbi:BABAM [Acanthosepion pharaonis]|uniref:BRISC and BRCA1-A complex member 1 n=1 Tax=Acanthosepion pharaonis TaxID=158019 RepID=A0A812E368_ACAPH|nr:BABAM [Sepia pharaonis]